MTTPQRPAPRFRFTLTHQILLGLVLGCLIGWLFPSAALSLKPVSQVFLRLIRMVVAPLILTTLVVGIAGAGVKMVGRLWIKAIIWFELATTVALFLGMVAANLIKPGTGIDLPRDTPAATTGKPEANVAPPRDASPASQGSKPGPKAEQPQAAPSAVPVVKPQDAAPKPPDAAPKPQDAAPKAQITATESVGDFITRLVPTSIFDAMARNDVLQIVVFSLFLGLALSAAGAKAARLREVVDAGAEAMFKLVGLVMWFAPFGVGAAIAVTISTSGTGVLVPLLKCVVTLYAALVVFFVVLFTAMKVLTRAHMPTFLAAIREPAIIAFTTASSEAALPRAMQVLEQLGLPRRIVGFVVPTGYAFNLDGTTLYLSLAVVFVAQAAGVEMSLGEQLAAMLLLMLSSKGVAGVPRAALVVLAGALAAFHLPPEGVALLLGIDALMDMGRTCVNVVGNCVASVVVATWENAIPADAPIFRPRDAPGPTLPVARVEADGERPGDGS
jgi:proton glutamate symport protein